MNDWISFRKYMTYYCYYNGKLNGLCRNLQIISWCAQASHFMFTSKRSRLWPEGDPLLTLFGNHWPFGQQFWNPNLCVYVCMLPGMFLAWLKMPPCQPSVSWFCFALLCFALYSSCPQTDAVLSFFSLFLNYFSYACSNHSSIRNWIVIPRVHGVKKGQLDSLCMS